MKWREAVEQTGFAFRFLRKVGTIHIVTENGNQFLLEIINEDPFKARIEDHTGPPSKYKNWNSLDRASTEAEALLEARPRLVSEAHPLMETLREPIAEQPYQVKLRNILTEIDELRAIIHGKAIDLLTFSIADPDKFIIQIRNLKDYLELLEAKI